jgi:hypothetical protein
MSTGQGQSTYDLYAARERAAACAKFNPCPLGESGDPAHNFTCALLCQDCGMNEVAHEPNGAK